MDAQGTGGGVDLKFFLEIVSAWITNRLRFAILRGNKLYLKIMDNFLNRNEVENIKIYLEKFYESHSSNEDLTKFGLANLVRGARNEDDKILMNELIKFFWKSDFPKFYKDRYGEEPLFLAEFCTFRRQLPVPDNEYVPWHLDANFYGFDVPTLTFWVPLVDVGVDAPGLEFCTPRNRLPLERIVSKWSALSRAEKPLSITDEQIVWLMETEEVDCNTIQIGPGDAAVFDQYVLHRTERNEKASAARIAVEFRVASASRPPAGVNLEAIGNMMVSHRDPVSGRVSLTSHGKYFANGNVT